MADITAPVASVASSVVSYPVAVAIGVPEPLALPIAVAAAGGASWAMSNREKVSEWTFAAVFSALSAWSFSWMIGATFGPVAGGAVLAVLPESVRLMIPNGALSVGCALVLSAIGISHALPLLIKAGSKAAGDVK